MATQPTYGERLVTRLLGSATRGGDLTADEMMVWLRGRLPDDPDGTERQLPEHRLEQLDRPKAWPADGGH